MSVLLSFSDLFFGGDPNDEKEYRDILKKSILGPGSVDRLFLSARD